MYGLSAEFIAIVIGCFLCPFFPYSFVPKWKHVYGLQTALTIPPIARINQNNQTNCSSWFAISIQCGKNMKFLFSQHVQRNNIMACLTNGQMNFWEFCRSEIHFARGNFNWKRKHVIGNQNMSRSTFIMEIEWRPCCSAARVYDFGHNLQFITKKDCVVHGALFMNIWH